MIDGYLMRRHMPACGPHRSDVYRWLFHDSPQCSSCQQTCITKWPCLGYPFRVHASVAAACKGEHGTVLHKQMIARPWNVSLGRRKPIGGCNLCLTEVIRATIASCIESVDPGSLIPGSGPVRRLDESNRSSSCANAPAALHSVPHDRIQRL